MTSNHHAPYDRGYTRATMAATEGSEGVIRSKPPGLVHTARHTMGVGNARSQWPNRKEGAAEGRSGNWGEVVTR